VNSQGPARISTGSGLLLSAAGAMVSLVNGSIKAVDGPFTERIL
jgi:hypothetical protein